MNQNKSNVPVSVAEEPDELSYYRLTLLSFLRESHPDLADDESFVTTRSDQAAEAFSAAIRSGLTYDDAAQQANALLFQGCISHLWTRWSPSSGTSSPPKSPKAAHAAWPCSCFPNAGRSSGYTLSDDFMFSPEFEQLYDELTGTVVIWLEENGL